MLNETFQLNADGKTRTYFFKIVPGTSTSKEVKAITLTFTVGRLLRILVIEGKMMQYLKRLTLDFIACFYAF